MPTLEEKQLDADFFHLFEHKNLAKDLRFLRRVAITIRHLHFFLPHNCKLKKFINSPLTESRVSLLQAADNLSEQDPLHSELSDLLQEIANTGPLFIRLPRASVDP